MLLGTAKRTIQGWLFGTLAGMLGAALALPSLAGPHEHGVAVLELSVESEVLMIRFSSPLDNLLGWERAPRNAAEQRQYTALREEFAQPAFILSIPDALACRLAETTVGDPYGHASAAPRAKASIEPREKALTDPQGKALSDPRGRASPDPQGKASTDPQGRASPDPHKDLEVEWVFRCAALTGLRTLTINAFDRFKRLRRVDVVYAIPGKSGKSRVTGRQRELKLL